MIGRPMVCDSCQLFVFEVIYKAVSFNRFGFLPEVVRGTQAMGFGGRAAVPLRAFPIVLAGKDLIGTAQTGTGKTAAFALPILTLLAKYGGLRCLGLEPPRGLGARAGRACCVFVRL